ncbi:MULTISPECIES: aminoglycoside 3'-phosphotransferase [unclassified Brevibacterium]|uniref:aminoglycoside 3'-phosphotransferase n=1 Tax=unclassified Brevibacterium TaxID=2614124 RepID=UPI0010F5B916|nr:MULTISPECIES: aminoglycoside 3'-phosphotransferase [unclassified Brevibacterium]MCM1011303.1 aminoglycoside 3'-phosphotransferase [Brevibacterium sp. XM4083]
MSDVDSPESSRQVPATLASTIPVGFALPVDILEFTGPDPEPIWLNEAGGVTVRFDGDTAGDGTRLRYLKRNPLPSSEDLALEGEKLEWLTARHPAPRVVDYVRRGDAEFLITEAIPGANAVAAVNTARANTAIAAIGEGLRRLHELPVDDCPWTWSVSDRLQTAEAERASTLGPAPEIDRLVVCHGDPCAPNTLLDATGTFVGHVDMQRLGVADRWADLAVTTMSFGWNYDEFDEAVFWDAYGIAPDEPRIRYYRELWDAE